MATLGANTFPAFYLDSIRSKSGFDASMTI
jgi:hypothetical protein